jgi:hypothetical protein
MNLNASTAGETKIETVDSLKSGTKSLRPKLSLFYCTSELLTALGAFSGADSLVESSRMMKSLALGVNACFSSCGCGQLQQPSVSLSFITLRT